MSEYADVYGQAIVTDNAVVKGHAKVYEMARVFGEAKVMDNARCHGIARVGRVSLMCGNADIMQPHNERDYEMDFSEYSTPVADEDSIMSNPMPQKPSTKPQERVSGFEPYAVLTLNKEQYRHIMNVLETADRIACGQTEEIKNLVPYSLVQCEAIRKIAKELKSIAFPELEVNESYSYAGGHPSKEWDKFQKQGYQIWREMMHQETLLNNETNTYTRDTLPVNGVYKPLINFGIS